MKKTEKDNKKKRKKEKKSWDEDNPHDSLAGSEVCT